MLWLCLRLPALVVEAGAPDERAALERLAAWAYQWSSLVAYRLSDGTDNGTGTATPARTPGAGTAGTEAKIQAEAAAPLLWLELAASATLFGGRDALLARIGGELARLGYSRRCAVAPSPSAAALLARTAVDARPCCTFSRVELRARLQCLPLSLLELPAQTLAALRSAGLRRIGEVLALPPAALARRFGPPCCHYLARLTATAADPRPAWRPPSAYRARCEFEQPVHDTTALLFPLQRLLQEFQGYLRARERAVQRCTLELEHPSAGTTRVTIGLSAPAHEAARLLRLARERLQMLVLAAPVRALQLVADEFTAPSILQPDLFGGQAQRLDELSSLLDRLRARLGGEAVQGCRCHPDHRPERAYRAVPPKSASAAGAPSSLRRPAALLPIPQPIAPPRELLCRPERIESGWWDGAQVRRDYYTARTADGGRQWVFRDLAGGGWYLQGWWV